MVDYLTVYKITYTPKTVMPCCKYGGKKKHIISQEFKDPMSEAFRIHLDLDESKPEKCVEELDSFFEKAKEKYPCVAKRFPFEKPVEKEVIRRLKIFEGRSSYQLDYCDVDDELEYKEWLKKNAIVLPEDVSIPLTTQKSSYRNPKMINSRAYVKDELPVYESDLDPNYKIRKILNVTTGLTEYMSRIGTLGEEIVVKELHGPVRHDFRQKEIDKNLFIV